MKTCRRSRTTWWNASGAKLMDVLQRYSNEKGYAALFDSSAQFAESLPRQPY
jgi:hypothetical protein